MASIGGLAPSKSFDSISQKFNGADAGTEIWGYCTMENNSSTNKVGRITVSTNFNGGNLNVAVGSSYGATNGASGTVGKGDSFSCYVSYLERSNYIVITVPQEIREEFTVEIAFSALTGREATFEVEQGLVYNGSLQYGIINLSNCSVVSGTRTGTGPGTYNCTLQANNSVKYSDCYYFDDGGVAQSLKSAVWTIAEPQKTDQTWTASNMSLEYGDVRQITINGTYYGSLSYKNDYDPDIITVDTSYTPAKVRAEKPGSTQLTIIADGVGTSYNPREQTITVTVSGKKTDQTWTASNMSLEYGDVRQITINGTYYGSLSYKNDYDPDIITVDTSYTPAKVRAEKPGSTQLTIIADGVGTSYNPREQTITVTVSGKKTDQTWTASDMSLEYGDVRQITINGTYYGSLSYKNDYDPDIITVDTSYTPAKVRAEKPGSTQLTIIADGVGTSYNPREQTITVTVSGKKTDQTWTASNMSLEYGDVRQITINGTYYGSLSYKNDYDPDIITVDTSYTPAKVRAEKPGSTQLTIIADGVGTSYNPREQTITVTVSGKKTDQTWTASDMSLEYGDVRQITINGTYYGSLSYKNDYDPDIITVDTSYTPAKVRAEKPGSTQLTIIADGVGTSYNPREQTITVTVSGKKTDQTWTASNMSLEYGDVRQITINGTYYGSLSYKNDYDSDIITVDTSYTPAKVRAEKPGSTQLTIIADGVGTSYNPREQTITITVSSKKPQTWEPNIKEATIKTMNYIDINVFGSIYGGLDFSTESSLITIINKTDTGCRVIAGNSAGSAVVKLYSPGTDAYDSKTVEITIYIKDDLIWVECNPHIYKNGKWIEMFPKIYKNGKWLSGIIKKYISKGDIYGK